MLLRCSDKFAKKKKKKKLIHINKVVPRRFQDQLHCQLGGEKEQGETLVYC